MRMIFAITTVCGMLGSQASAYCFEPSFSGSAPSAPGSYRKPNEPFCLSGYEITRQHSCSDWEIQAYITEVNEYLRLLRTYYEEAVDFANQAARFSDEALEFAKCEAAAYTE